MDPGANTTTSQYDGTSWATNPSTASEREFGGYGMGNNPVSGSWYVGGTSQPGSYITATEEFTSAVETATAKSLTTS